MLSNYVDWSKLSKFFQIGDDNNDVDREQYESIVDSSVAYMNDETIENHNISSLTSETTMNGNKSGASSMVVHFDKTGMLASRDIDSKSTSTFGDENESDDSSDYLDNVDNIDNIDSKQPPLLGMLLVTLSAICYAALNLSVKALMDETPWQELMIIRMGITWIATMIWILYKYRGEMSLFGPKDKRLLLTWRAFFLWGAMFCCWWSFEFLPVGDGTTLAMSFPVWVTLIAHFVFRGENDGISSNLSQRLDKIGWICVFSGLAGVIFVAQPSFLFGSSDSTYGPGRDVGIVLGLCSAVCAGAQYVIVNYTKEDCHWLQVEQITAFLSTFVFMPIGFAAFAAVRYYNTGVFSIGWENLNGIRWVEEIALGLLGFCALALLTRGSQLDAPARTAICLYLQIPVTYAGQCIMTRTFPNGFVFVGILLVLASVIVPALRKLRAAKDEKLKKQKLREEAKLARKMAKARHNTDMNGNVSDVDSEIGSSGDESENERIGSGNERDALLEKYRREGIINDLNEVPKYTINVSNSSLSIGGRNGRRGRLYSKHGTPSGRYNDYESSSSDDSL